MFLQHPAETAEVDRLYQGDMDSLGYVMNLMRAAPPEVRAAVTFGRASAERESA